MNLYNWQYDNFLDVNNKPFDSWDAWVGPHTFNDDQFTATSRYNVSVSLGGSYHPGRKQKEKPELSANSPRSYRIATKKASSTKTSIS